MPKSKIFKIAELSKSFDETVILDDVSFDINRGEILAITGRSGGGKSTLLKMLGGLMEANSGDIAFDGESILPYADHLVPGHEEIKYMAQDFKLLHRRTVLENLTEALLAFNDSFTEEKVEQLTNIFRLQTILDYRIEQLSGGEKQRLSMARAMATEPQVLLLDEPFTQLDQLNRSTLFDALRAANQELSTTIVFITHQTDEIFQLADRVGVLVDKNLKQIDTPEKVFLQPHNLETAELFGKINVFNEQLLNVCHIDSKKGLIGLRPYHLEITAKSQKNGLNATVLSCKFMGGYYQVVCELEKNLKWTVHSEHAHKAGEQIFLSFEKSHLIEMDG